MLKQYKTLLKLTTRDASLEDEYESSIASTLRQIERWIAEAKIGVDISVADFGRDLMESDGEMKERAALELLSDALMEPGILVPLSKK